MMADAEVYELDNGVRVAAFRMPHMHSVCIGLWSGVGSRHETVSLNGISHFLEHLLFRGTPQRSARRIVHEIESRGGIINAFTSEDHTCYYVKVEASQAPVAIEVLADMYCNASLRLSDTEQERAIILEEIRGYRDNHAARVEELLDDALWPGHILGMPVTGSEESLGRITNRQLQSHHHRYYKGNHTVVAVAGNYTGKVLSGVNERLASLGRGQPIEGGKHVPRSRRLFRVECSDTEQCHVELGFRTFGRHQRDRYALRLISVLLGENMSSNLFQKLREKHALCYHLQSDLNLLEDTGALTLQLALDAGNLPRALRMIRQECEQLKRSGVSQTRLNAARRYVLGQLRMARDSVTQRMLLAGESLLGYGRVITDREIEDAYQKINTSDIKKVAEKVLNLEKMVSAVVCHERDQQQVIKAFD